MDFTKYVSCGHTGIHQETMLLGSLITLFYLPILLTITDSNREEKTHTFNFILCYVVARK